MLIRSVLFIVPVVVVLIIFPEGCGDMVVLPAVLAFHLSVVEVAEVWHDDGHWQWDSEHARYRTHGAHQLSPDRPRDHVPVAYGGHGHHSPPKRLGYAGEKCVVTVHLGEVRSAGKKYHPDEEEEDKECKFPQAGLQRLTKDLEAFGVTRKLEDPEDSYQPDNSDEGQGDGWWRAFVLGELCAHGDKKWQNGQEVDDVHDVLEEVYLARRADEAHDELKGEPADADGLDYEEWVLEGWELWRDLDGYVGDGRMRRRCVLLKEKVRRSGDSPFIYQKEDWENF